jgi:hypothetical protein
MARPADSLCNHNARQTPSAPDTPTTRPLLSSSAASSSCAQVCLQWRTEGDYGRDRGNLQRAPALDRVILRGEGWRVEAEVWEGGKEGMVKEEIRLPANYYLRSPRAALAFVKRRTQRGIDRRQQQERGLLA